MYVGKVMLAFLQNTEDQPVDKNLLTTIQVFRYKGMTWEFTGSQGEMMKFPLKSEGWEIHQIS